MKSNREAILLVLPWSPDLPGGVSVVIRNLARTWQAADVPSRYQALYLMTRGSAWMSNEEKVKGAIKPGQYADLVVLPRDYFTMDIEQVKNLESELTIVNGKVVYAAGAYEALAPQLPAISPAWSPVKYFGGYQNRAQ